MSTIAQRQEDAAPTFGDGAVLLDQQRDGRGRPEVSLEEENAGVLFTDSAPWQGHAVTGT